MAFKDVMNLRKSGKEEEAYNMAIADYNQDQNDIWAKRALSWCIYDGLKSSASYEQSELFLSKLNELIALDLSATEEMLWKNVVWPINAFIRNCSKSQGINDEIYDAVFESIREFHFVKPSQEYSVLLNAFLTAKEWNGIMVFCEWWGFENFRKEDYECEVLPNGRKMPVSLVESAHLAMAKTLINKKDKEAILAFIPKLQDLAEHNPQMQYPNYYVGKLLLASGSDKQEAVSALLSFARKKQNEFWVWQLLAEALEEDDEKCMACLLRAAHCNIQEHFLVKVYLLLAGAFEQLHYYADARFYLDKYCQIKAETQTNTPNDIQDNESNDVIPLWDHKKEKANISNVARRMLRETWYTEAKGKEQTFNLDYMSITNELLYGDMPETNAVVSFVNKDKKMASVVYGKMKEGFFKYERFVKKLNAGDSIKLRIQEVSADGFMKVFSVRVSETLIVSDYCKEVKGTVSSNPSMTAFFLQSENESYYIPSHIVSKMQLIVGEPVSAVVLYSYNKKKGEWKWSCVKIDKQK